MHTTEWKNLAPDLIRQRLIIEATTKEIVKPEQIKEYLIKLAEVSKMEVLSGPYTSNAHELGFSGWIHWRTSGAHVYSYYTNLPLLTVDTYTCKPFSIQKVVDFTKEFFGTVELVWKEVKV